MAKKKRQKQARSKKKTSKRKRKRNNPQNQSAVRTGHQAPDRTLRRHGQTADHAIVGGRAQAQRRVDAASE